MNFIERFFLFLAGRLGGQYESEHTRFMEEYMERHPEEADSQRRGRAIWWDKTGDERSPHPSMCHAPRSGGAEHTFVPQVGGSEYAFAPDDNTNAKG
jgi:hypothetical protein